MILQVPWRGPLTEEEAKNGFMLFLKDDTEDAPWMVMGSLQWDATADLYQSLREYVHHHQRPWTVAAMHPIRYSWPSVPGKRQLAPDLFVALVPYRPRPSFDVEVEGGFPPFVLEVVSPTSAERDKVEKRNAYDLLEVREYALFTPEADRPSELEGYRRDATGSFGPWPRDEQGRLWSEVLGLYLVVEGMSVRAATREGELLPTFREAVAARREAEADNERLREENERLRRQVKTESGDLSDPPS